MKCNTVLELAEAANNVFSEEDNYQITNYLTNNMGGYCYLGAFFKNRGFPIHMGEFGASFDGIPGHWRDYLLSTFSDCTPDDLDYITSLNDSGESYSVISEKLLERCEK